MMATHLVCSEQLLTGVSYEYGTSLLFDASRSGQRPMALDSESPLLCNRSVLAVICDGGATLEEIKYVQRYAKDARIADSRFNEAA